MQFARSLHGDVRSARDTRSRNAYLRMIRNSMRTSSVDVTGNDGKSPWSEARRHAEIGQRWFKHESGCAAFESWYCRCVRLQWHGREPGTPVLSEWRKPGTPELRLYGGESGTPELSEQIRPRTPVPWEYGIEPGTPKLSEEYRLGAENTRATAWTERIWSRRLRAGPFYSPRPGFGVVGALNGTRGTVHVRCGRRSSVLFH